MTENKMGVMPIKKLVWSMSLPIMVSMLIQALYNIVDSMFVAQMGEKALAAVSYAFPIQMMIIALSVGTGVGINSLLSRFLGSGDLENASATAENGIFLELCAWVLFLLFGFLGARPFALAFSSDPEIVEMCTQYTSICCIFSFGVFVQLAAERIMQSTGNPVYHMVVQGVGAVLNIVLDPILIFGLLGMPKLGVAGAAIATVIGQIVAMIIGLYLSVRKVKEVRISLRGFRPNKAIIKGIYQVGVPAIFMQSVTALMMVGMNSILTQFSDLAVSVFNIYYKLQNFIFMPIYGLNNAMIPIVGYNYGARNRLRITASVRFSVMVSVGIMAVGLLLFQLFPQSLMLLFNAKETMMSIGVPALRIISISFVFAGVTIVLTSVFQAVGNGIMSLVVTLGRQLVLLLPMAYLFANFIDLRATWAAFPIAEILCTLLSLVFLRRIYQTHVKSLPEGAPVQPR